MRKPNSIADRWFAEEDAAEKKKKRTCDAMVRVKQIIRKHIVDLAAEMKESEEHDKTTKKRR